MCGLGHLFEQQGIATTTISLIRLHAEKIAPPRALWVPFDLGRPFGAANDAAFQREVVMSALSLLERDSGPVLDDFPHNAPDSSSDETTWSCPISFARREEKLSGAEAIKKTLLNEIAVMQPWYDRAVSARGRSESA